MMKLASGILLGFGILCLVAGIYAPFNPENGAEKKRAQCVAGLLASAPLLIGGVLLIRQSQHNQRKQERDRLQAIFYRLLQEQNGRLSALRLAVESALEYKVAKAYLDDQAVELTATFEVDDQGGVLYCFPTSGLQSPAVIYPTSSPSLVPESTRIDVLLGMVPATQKIAAIKVIRQFTGLGLKESKTMIDSAPQVLRQVIRLNQWQAFAAAMAAIGVQVRQVDDHSSET